MSDGESLGFIVADDHPLVRQGVRMVLETEHPNCMVVEAPDLDTTLAAVIRRPDSLLLIDLDMPGMNGSESLRALRQDFPLLLMAVLSGNDDRQIIMDAVNAGVNGYILKASPPDEFLYAIETIRGGRVYLNDKLWRSTGSTIPAARSATCNAPKPAPSVAPTLTPRQLQVTRWLMQGHSNKQIARDLEIGEGTVKIHLAAIFRTLGAQNRTEAVMIASRLGL
jgi:DNA-binding NarL/FixJ family response regulator